MARLKKPLKKWLGRIFITLISVLVLALVAGLFAMTVFTVPDKPRAEIVAKYTDEKSIFLTLSDLTTLHLKDEGPKDAPALVMIHGSNASLHTWDAWTEELKGKYRIIRMDLPGHGVTGPTYAGDYTSHAMAATIVETLNHLKIKRAVFVGSSMGGAVALRIALKHPKRVRGLVLIGSAGLKTDSQDSRPFAFRIAGTPGISGLTRYITPYWAIERSVLDAYGTPVAVTPALVRRYYDLLLHVGNRAATSQRLQQQTAEEPMDIYLGGIITPTLLIWGEEDSFVPLKYGRRMNAYILTSELITYPGVGHLPMETSPKLSAMHADKFIQEEIIE